ncbi:MAG TPA: nicotinate phosphoribosyltransferase [Candidatus Dormibacteraeota bacterium]|nr:nicotinate phosphoribosyltransferase [Candidatus Dormibacteraeota bacterium]
MTHNPTYSGLLTDLYELTMAAGYLETGFDARATFELFVRSLPSRRNYLVAAGLDQALDFLEGVRFSGEEIAYLRTLPVFGSIDEKFFDYLSQFRFSGDVWAMPEGTVFFPGEPILRVAAPVIEAQIAETSLLSAINFQSMIASKAARVTQSAAGRNVIEFGTRRAHGAEAGVLAARAAVIGGCLGSSNVAAGQRFGISVYGTQAHSWIMAHENEEQAFGKFLDIFPNQAVLLVDTYDVRAAVEKIIAMGRKPRGVRLDSGDLAADSIWVRNRLDQAGWKDVIIFASGDLDENRIADLLSQGARIDGFGVGTSLVNSSDSPTLGVIYKLVETEYGGEIRSAAKFSTKKVTYPGSKQVFRFRRPDGNFENDIIGLEEEKFPGAEPLLDLVMTGGKRSAPPTDLFAARERCLEQRARLPQRLLGLSGEAEPFPVKHSEKLEKLLGAVRLRMERAARI